MVNHRQNPATGRLNRQHGAVHVAERVRRGLAHNGIFTCGRVASGLIRINKRAGSKVFVITMPTVMMAGVQHTSAYAAAR